MIIFFVYLFFTLFLNNDISGRPLELMPAFKSKNNIELIFSDNNLSQQQCLIPIYDFYSKEHIVIGSGSILEKSWADEFELSYQKAIKFFKSILSLINNNQGVLTIVILFLGYWQWKRTHIKERESNYYFQILEKTINLRYLILEQRQPRFLPSNGINKKYIEESVIPNINNIISLSYSIIKQLSSIEEILHKQDKPLTNFFRQKISIEVIKEISMSISLFLMDAGEKEIIALLFPSETGILKYEVDDTGLNIIDDDFNKTVESNFRFIINEIEKFII